MSAEQKREGRSSTAAHTPGPWRVLEWADENKGFIAVVGPDEPAQHVCDVFPFGKRAETQSLTEHKDNARLIAAAPNMLADAGNVVHSADYGDIPSERGAAFREQIVQQERSNAHAMVEGVNRGAAA